MKDDYVCPGQMNIFDFLDSCTFDPLKEFAKRGSGFVRGKERIQKFFSTCSSSTERANFLKEEYGIGGFGSPVVKQNYIHSGDCDYKGVKMEYYDSDLKSVELKATYRELAAVIDDLIKSGDYITEKGE